MRVVRLEVRLAIDRIRGLFREPDARGIGLIVVLLVMAVFFVLATALLVLGEGEHVIAVNEQDHLKGFGHAEAGLSWARLRLLTAAESGTFLNYTDLLLGPDNASATDNYLIGLRDLSLTATNQFTSGNEATASAIVSRNFDGAGALSYEVVRINDGAGTRALVYTRIDDNFDENPDDPTANNPLADTDRRITLTVVTEYPVFVDGSGVETADLIQKRGRARSKLEAKFGPETPLPAVATNGDMNISGNPVACGACGSIHANDDVGISGNPNICKDLTASDTWTNGGSPTIGRDQGGNFPTVKIPVINPYDDLYVPAPGVFNTSTLTALPAELRCAGPSVADPGNSKYFAFVSDSVKGKVFKAYYDFTLLRWEWRQIDDLNDGTDLKLDNCGRVVSGATADPFAGAGVTDKPGDAAGVLDEFYGFKQASTESSAIACASCGSAGQDQSLCNMATNNRNQNAYFNLNDTVQASVTNSQILALPGGKSPDVTRDFRADSRIQGGVWNSSASDVFSPLYGAVIFVYGNVEISGNVGSSGGRYCNAAGCGSSGSVPQDTWALSLITYGYVRVSGNPSYSPANPASGYHFLFVAGRDVNISGNPGATPVCGGGCSSTTPSNIDTFAGVIAAHEQIQMSGDPQIIGFLLSENAIDCDPEVNGGGQGTSTINGNPSIFYDCNNPPNPYQKKVYLLSWQENE